MKLNQVKHNHNGKLWCGLAALSAVTGFGTDYCKAQIRDYINNDTNKVRSIKGIYHDELLAAFKRLSIDTILVFRESRKEQQPSLARFLHKFKTNKLFVIHVTGHYIVTNGQQIIDSFRPNGCNLYDHPFIDVNVVTCWEVEEIKCEDL